MLAIKFNVCLKNLLKSLTCLVTNFPKIYFTTICKYNSFLYVFQNVTLSPSLKVYFTQFPGKKVSISEPLDMVDAVKEALKEKKSIEGTPTEEEVVEESKRSKA